MISVWETGEWCEAWAEFDSISYIKEADNGNIADADFPAHPGLVILCNILSPIFLVSSLVGGIKKIEMYLK